MWWMLPIPILAWLIGKMFSSDSKTLLTGPPAAGKTTFLRYFITNKEIPVGSSAKPIEYQIFADKSGMLDVVTDFSGADAWLNNFDKKIEEHDNIIFFFDVSKFINEEDYRKNTNARIDFIFNKLSLDKLVVVGTHIDKAKENYVLDVENFFAGKKYQQVLKRIVYVNMTKPECVETIVNKLKS